MKISVIIPTFNEATTIGKLIAHLKKANGTAAIEIIVTDGGSTDDTVAIATSNHVIVHISSKKGRAAQMNEGAAQATGDVLYFVHADTIPPLTFIEDIQKAIAEGYGMGRYQTKFDSPSILLKLNAFFTRFDWEVCYGGDQTLFIQRSIFETTGGFKADMKIMEEFEFVKRARAICRFKILNGKALISTRKYHKNSWLKVQRANAKIVRMYKAGATQEEMITAYKQLLNWD